MTNYAAGWSMAGYSPDPDHIYITDDYSSAVTYLVDTVDRWWDSDYDTDDDKSDIDGRYLPAHTELHNLGDSKSDVSVAVYDANGYAYHLWIMETDQPIDEEG